MMFVSDFMRCICLQFSFSGIFVSFRDKRWYWMTLASYSPLGNVPSVLFWTRYYVTGLTSQSPLGLTGSVWSMRSVCAFLGTPRELISLPFSLLKATRVPGVLSPPSISKASNFRSCVCHAAICPLLPYASLFYLKESRDYTDYLQNAGPSPSGRCSCYYPVLRKCGGLLPQKISSRCLGFCLNCFEDL